MTIQRDFEAWRRAARALLLDEVSPDNVLWAESGGSEPLLAGLAMNLDALQDANLPATTSMSVPRNFVDVARYVACHRDEARWDVLYRALWRLAHGERHLLDLAADPLVQRLHSMHRSVRRDRHKMTAFVRFRRIEVEGAEQFVAFHRPDHFIARLTAPFFATRFATMRWTILTPDESASWNGTELAFGPGVPASAAPQGDDLEELWRAYYGSIFNPARIRLRAMTRELPVRHWRTLPEAGLIDDLIRDAPARVEEMMKRTAAAARKTTGALPGRDGRAAAKSHPESGRCAAGTSAREFLPEKLSLPVLREAARVCRGCELYCRGTQTVFGEGPDDAKVMFVGEQPGDSEDRAGRPFVGPAGQLLDEALAEAGVPREEVYVTNAVKHFKWEPRGKRRIHAKPSAREVTACKPWLEAEIQVVKPRMIVCLGATAAQALLGRDFRVTQHRGEVLKTDWADWILATVHPSSLLRIPEADARREAYEEFVGDLRVVAKQMSVVTTE